MDNKEKYIDISSSIADENALPDYNEQDANGKDVNYWRSFSELYNDKEFRKAKAKEFDKEAGKDLEVSKMSGVSRRKFLALMGASAALAAAGCSNYRDKGELVPYNKLPEGVSIGNPNYYASTCTGCAEACGILVKTREGRPIKIDGNPDHPVSKGKICAKGQATIMDLYEPERLKSPMFSGNKKDFKDIDWKEADTKIIDALKKAASSGKEIALLTGAVISPSFQKLLADFTAAYPTAKAYSYELYNDASKNGGWAKQYGGKAYPSVSWDKAKIILALESDFLGMEGNTQAARLFASGRDVMTGKDFNRLYSVEGDVSLTGMNADYRMRLRTDAIEEFVMCVLNEVVNKRKAANIAVDGGVASGLGRFNLEEFGQKHKMNEEALKHLVDDLMKNQGASYVSAGSKLPESTHIAVNLLNEALGNTKLYTYDNDESFGALSTRQDIENFINDINSGKTGVVIHCDTNPVYHFAKDYNYGEAIKKVPVVITMADMPNETAAVSDYVLPSSHALESWGDFRTKTTFYSFQQPVISPLYQNRQKEAMMLVWVKGNADAYNEQVYHDYIADNWKTGKYPSMNQSVPFDKFWNSALHDGVVKSTAAPAPTLTFNQQAAGESMGRMMKEGDGFVLLLNEGNLGDGRFANNGWMQELPHPLSKIVWDNYAAISPDTAKELGVNSNDVLEVTVEGRKQKIPAFVQPGMADKVIAVSLGYGRTSTGTVGNEVGVNVNVLMSAKPALSERLYNGVQVSKTGETYELVSTVEHYPIDNERYKDIQFKREIIREGTYLEYKENPKLFAKEEEEEEELRNFPSINDEHKYTGIKWGMAIDMNKCIGCGECTVACSAENNIPIVGKDQVKVNREMHWLRTDRYYSGTPQDPKTSFQLMLCQHCEMAPCENVCPVAATTHSPDGINVMAYNRCVGTRYCGNNCPYKVRRFNYFNFRDHFKDAHYQEQPVNLMYNPEVTVRSRGVMEKCNFCVQRIMHARQHATEEKRQLKGTDVTTACQDACSTNAILFGDMNDESSELKKYMDHNISYFVLNEIKTRPSIAYVAKLRNTYEASQTGEHKTEVHN